MSKILFVDDEAAILEVTKLLLRSIECEAYLASSGHEAIEILSDKDKQQEIKIIFLDLEMPRMNGLEVLEWVNKNNIKIPTILQTGLDDKKKIGKAMALGIKDRNNTFTRYKFCDINGLNFSRLVLCLSKYYKIISLSNLKYFLDISKTIFFLLFVPFFSVLEGGI
jgi:CheY-like chemotaxis protein